MSEIDQPTSNAIAQLRAEWSPPSGAEERMLADFHARLGSGPPDGGEGPPTGDGGLPSAGPTGQALYVAKIIMAVAGLTAAGLGGVVVAAKLIRGPERASSPTLERASVVATPELVIEPPAPIEPAPIEPASTQDDPPASPASLSPKPRQPAPKLDLAAELALIQEARVAKPEQALALLDRHRREFRNGALTNEREALQAAASCALGRLDDARAAIDRLVALDPGPLLRQRVEAACANKIDLPTTVFARGGDSSL